MGILAFSISLIPILYIIVQVIVDIFINNYTQSIKISLLLLRLTVFIAVISFVLCLISMFQRETRKLLPTIGLILSCLILLIPILGSM